MTVRERYAYWCDSGMTVIIITNCFLVGFELGSTGKN